MCIYDMGAIYESLLPMRIPVSPAHQEKTLVRYSIPYLRLERLL
jgi:hypothetical protein